MGSSLALWGHQGSTHACYYVSIFRPGDASGVPPRAAHGRGGHVWALAWGVHAHAILAYHFTQDVFACFAGEELRSQMLHIIFEVTARVAQPLAALLPEGEIPLKALHLFLSPALFVLAQLPSLLRVALPVLPHSRLAVS